MLQSNPPTPARRPSPEENADRGEGVDQEFRHKDGGDRDSDGPGRNAERSFHKEKRCNETHQSTTVPEARLYKKVDGQPAKLCYTGVTP